MIETKTDRVEGERGGYLSTHGRYRFSTLNGVPYVVGRGRAWKCDTIPEALAQRDKLLAEEKAKREAVR